MSLNIKNPHADELARAVAAIAHENITEAVIKALEERLSRLEGRSTVKSTKAKLLEIGNRCSALPDIDKRSPESILGYDEHGLPR